MERKHYKIAFCGLGSIGKRHLRNTAEYLSSKGATFQFDWIRSSARPMEDDIAAMIRNTYSYSDCVPQDYDIIFVTNPTSEHFETVRRFARHTNAMFIEKPVFDRADADLALLDLPDNGIYYVACPLRYTNVLRYVKKNVDCSRAYSVRAICSSYLPDWRPGTDYRKTYSAHSDQGGGVSIDLIHEWDYLIDLFGIPEKVMNVRGKYSDLEIDSDDLSVYIGVSPNRITELHLDYFGRKGIRKLQIFLPEETVEADLYGGTVSFLREGRTVDLSEERNDFQMKEIRHFFEIVDGICENDNDISQALCCLRVAAGRL